MEVHRKKNGETGNQIVYNLQSKKTIKMQRWHYYILTLMSIIVLGSCSDDIEQEGHDVHFCVRAVWQDGLSGNKTTRALSATDILSDGTEDIAINYEDYPATINVHCSDGTDFSLTKSETKCTIHNDYWSYTPNAIYKDNKIKRDNLTFTATATIDDDGDILTGDADFDSLKDLHMQFTLHHTQALLRFAFKVNENYDKIRYIQVTQIQLNGKDAVLVDKVLSTSSQYIAYAYIDPTEVTVSTVNTIECTYDIYDKDASWDVDGTPASDNADHITRHDVTATNRFKLGNLRKDDVSVSTISPGYYYDLIVTINPDYLYVLSEHDNQHLTIN